MRLNLSSQKTQDKMLKENSCRLRATPPSQGVCQNSARSLLYLSLCPTFPFFFFISDPPIHCFINNGAGGL